MTIAQLQHVMFAPVPLGAEQTDYVPSITATERVKKNTVFDAFRLSTVPTVGTHGEGMQ